MMLSEIYTWVFDDGRVFHVDVGGLREACQKHAPGTIEVTLSQEAIDEMLKTAEQPRIDRLRDVPVADFPPIIVLVFDDDNTHAVASGNHRCISAWQRGQQTVRGWAVPQQVWEHFLVRLPKHIEDAFVHDIREGNESEFNIVLAKSGLMDEH